MTQCRAALIIKGEHFSCDYKNNHAFLSHRNKEHEAIWASHDEVVRYDDSIG